LFLLFSSFNAVAFNAVIAFLLLSFFLFYAVINQCI